MKKAARKGIMVTVRSLQKVNAKRVTAVIIFTLSPEAETRDLGTLPKHHQEVVRNMEMLP